MQGPVVFPAGPVNPNHEQAGYLERVVYVKKYRVFALYTYVSIYEPLVPSRAYIFILRVPCNSVGIYNAVQRARRTRVVKRAHLRNCHRVQPVAILK